MSSTNENGVSDAREYRALRSASLSGTLPPAQQARLSELTARWEAARAATEASLLALRAEMASPERARAFAEMGIERSERVQARLKALPPGTVLVHAVVLPDHLTLLVTTPEAQVSRQVEVDEADVNRAVAALRDALTTPSGDPRPAAQRLYDLLLRPLEADLAQAQAQTLLVWLDGVLRYVPLSALHDGSGWVAERWATVVYTAASEGDLLRTAAETPAVAAFGSSRAVEVGEDRFEALPSVPSELDAVVGTVGGRPYLDEAFTRQSLADALEGGVPWVHVASHFHFQAGGTEADSYLLLGDGTPLSVQALRQGDFPLAGVDLLALSACDTGMGQARADGSEVEGLAVVAQDKGAGAVLASLWPVADTSTAAWMVALYQRLSAGGLSRPEAVRQVQLAFVRGEVRADALPGPLRDARPMSAPPATPSDPSLAGWRHPYHWAPFVLYGAGR